MADHRSRMGDTLLTDKLCNASARGDLDGVLSLLQAGADVNGFNKYSRTPLQVVMLGSSAVAQALLEWGADPDRPDPRLGLTVTHDAAREGFADTVRELMAHEADVNLPDNHGNLPLHLAAREGHLQVVQLLIGRTADPQARNGQGDTAGQLARRHSRVDTAAYIDQYLSSD